MKSIYTTILFLLLAVTLKAQPSSTLRTFTMSDGLPSSMITTCATDHNGMLWIATWNGLCNYDGYRFNTFTRNSNLSTKRLKAIVPTIAGDVYVCTFDFKLYKLSKETQQFEDCQQFLKDNGIDIESLFPLDEDMWIIGKNGKNLRLSFVGEKKEMKVEVVGSSLLPKALVDRMNERETPPTIYYNGAEIIPNKFWPGTQNNLWFTAEKNLSLFRQRSQDFRYIPIKENVEVRSVESNRNGTIYAGCKDGTIALLDKQGEIKGYLTPSGSISSTPTAFCDKGIYAMLYDSQDRLWIGTRGDGMYLLQHPGTGGAVKHYSEKDNNSPISCDDFFAIAEDRKGRIWFGTYKCGIICYDNYNDSFYSSLNTPSLQLPEGDIRKVRRITCSEDGTICMSTADGLIMLSDDFQDISQLKMQIISSYSEKGKLLSRDILQTLDIKNGSLISTLGGGLQLVKINKGAIESAEEIVFSQGFEVGNIQSMVCDKRGNIWIVGENSIRKMNPDCQEENTFTSAFWGKDVVMSEGKTCFDDISSNIIIPTMGGVIIFNPEQIAVSGYKPAIVFSGIQYQGDESIQPLVGNNMITLPVDKHNAVIYFAALDYSNTAQLRYAYRIKEMDEEWTYVGKEHCAALSNLPSGEFTLEVRSTNGDGVWQDNNTEISIYVEPTFWQTPWAFILYALILGAVLYAFFYIYRLRNEAAIEKTIKEKQLRFFTNISHQLRTPLTLIGGPVSEVLKTAKLSEQDRNYLVFVENNAKQMLSLVDKSLSLEKLQEGVSGTGSHDPELGSGRPVPVTQEEELASDNNIPTLPSESAADILAADDITILVVEDNDELRYFLTTALSSHYNIIEAENGQVGLKLATEKQPDFIITDIMMPEMDGITMIRRIKADNAICHIPIIILSARTADVYRIEGLKEGADDYITKPFSISYLQLRVESIIHNRRLLQETWRNHISEPQTETSQKETLSKADRRFVELLTEYVRKNLSNDKLVIEDIATALSLSRSVFYGKVRAIYGFSPSDFVKNMRINHACEMLIQHPEKNISEIAYSSGFSDPKYFARAFKASKGMSPSEYRKEA